MKRLILHLGFGKTGSSALQSWLAHNQKALASAGYWYANPPQESLDFAVSSGNGMALYRFLVGQPGLTPDDVYATYFNEDLPGAIVSSEIIDLSGEAFSRMRALCREKGVSLRVIAFVRNIYDHCYADYVQQIKRFNLDMEFRDFAINNYSPLHITRTQALLRQIENPALILYEDARGNVARAFCEAAGIAYGTETGSISPRTVNRSLDSDEIAVVRFFNRWRGNHPAAGLNVSKIVSDYLLADNPERAVFRPRDARVLEMLSQRYGEDLARVRREAGVSLRNWSISAERLDGDVATSDAVHAGVLNTGIRAVVRNIDEFPDNTLLPLIKSIHEIEPRSVAFMGRALLREGLRNERQVRTLIGCASELLEDEPLEAARLLDTAHTLDPDNQVVAGRLAVYRSRLRSSERFRLKLGRLVGNFVRS